MRSRYFVIALALGVAVYRASQGGWVEAAGLFGLGAGLVILKLSAHRPTIRRVAYLGFAMTALSVVTLLLRWR